MIVWLVIAEDYDYQQIQGAYVDEEDAKRHAEFATHKRGPSLVVEGFNVWDEFSEDRFTKDRYLRAATWRAMESVNGA